ncbi:unnamed protein product, partial [Prorocentrum cordatum]
MTCWMCSCGGWNWDWRTTRLGCGHAPPRALEAAAAKAKLQADKGGWVDQPRGRRAQRRARSAATSAATSKPQASASCDSGAPSGSGATAIERLQVAVEQLEALQAEPPDGADGCFTDVVASQLEAKRAELAEAQRAAAEQKASSMPLSTLLHKEANAISKAEKRLRAARQSLEQKQAARGLAEAQLQKAQEELAQFDAEVARAAIRAQVGAVRAQLAEALAVPRRAPWAESRPMDEISGEDCDHAGGSGPWQPQCAAERGQAERRGDAHGEWPKVAQACKRELAAEAEDLAPLAARPAGRAAGSRGGGAKPRQQEGGGAEAARIGGKRPLDLGSAQAPPAPGQAATAAQDVRCGLEELGINGNAWRKGLEEIEALDSRSWAPPHLAMLQETRLAPHRLEEAAGAARRMGYAAFLHASAPTDKEGPLAHSGGAAALVRSDLQAAVIAWQVPSDLRHCVTGATASAASDLLLLACSMHLQDGLGPKGVNLDFLAAVGDMVLYASPRFFSVMGLAAGSFSANGTVLAGCAWATTVGKLPVLAALRAASAGGRPRGVARNVVDDIAPQAVGTERRVAALLGNAGLEVARSRRGLHLPLSAAKEYMEAESELQERFAERAGLRMRRAELRGRRDLDPAAFTAGHAVQRRAGLLQSGELPPRIMERGLEAAATRHARADTPWKHCASPFDAVVLTCARIGWHFKSERCMVTDLGDELDLMHLGPRELGSEAGLGAQRAPVRREMRKLSHGALLLRPLYWGAIGRLLGPDSGPRVWEQNVLEAYISNAHWTQARLFDAGERRHARCCGYGAERGTLWHRLFGCPVLEPQRRDGVSARLKRGAERARAPGERAGDNFGRCWPPAPEPPQGRRTDAMWVQYVCRPADDKLNGKLYLDGSALEPQVGALRGAGWAIAQCDDGNLVAGVYGIVWRDLCPQQTAKDGEDLAAWMIAASTGPAVEEVNIDCSHTARCLRRRRAHATAPCRANAHLRCRILAALEPGTFEVKKVPAPCSRQAVLDGLLTEAQRRGNEHADRLAEMGAQMHAVDRLTVGVHHALAEIVQELGRWIWWAAIIWPGIEARDCEGLPPTAERRQGRFAAAEVSRAAEDAASDGPMAKQPRLDNARSTGSSSAALSASAVAFSIPGHALSYACAGEGEGTQELVACSKCGAYMTLGGRSGVRPRLKERCPGDKTDKGGRNQRSLWLRGLHPKGRRQEGSRAARHRVKGEGIPALRSQGPVPEHAQERYLERLGTAVVPAVDSSATASSAGSAPAAAAEPHVAAGPGEAPADAADAAAAASLPLRRPAAARTGLLGAFGATEEELAAAAGATVEALEDRRVRRRMARRGGPTV